MNNMETTDRVNFLDFLKCLAIILVIIGHLLPDDYLLVKSYIYSFHMPLFFIISGLLYYINMNKDYSVRLYMKKNIKTMIIPTLLWAMIYCNFTAKNLMLILYGSHQSFSIAKSLSSLWFVPCFFISNCLYILLCHKKSDKTKLFWLFICVIIIKFLPSISIGYPLSLNTAFTGLSFIIIGFFMYSFINKLSWPLIVIMGIISLLFCFNDNDSYILMAENLFNNEFLFYIVAIAGSLFMIGISLKCNLKNNVISFIGQNTLIIMFTHKIIIYLTQSILNLISLPPLLYTLVSIIVVIPISIIFVDIINHYSLFLGGNSILWKWRRLDV